MVIGQEETLVVQCGDFLDRSGRSTTVNTSNNNREEVDIIQYIHSLQRGTKN